MVHTNPFGKFQKLLAIGFNQCTFSVILEFLTDTSAFCVLFILHLYYFDACKSHLKGIRKIGTSTVPKLEAFNCQLCEIDSALNVWERF